MYYLFAENDSNNFQMLGAEVISRSDTLPTGIRLECYDFGGDIKLLWKSLIVRAERMTWHPGPLKGDISRLKVIQADGSGLRTVIVPSSSGFRYVGSPEWSTDGRKLVVDMSDGNFDVAHVVVVDSDGAGLTDLGPGCMPSFSGDGSRIAFSQAGLGVMTMKADGTDRQVVDRSGWGIQWSPDGRWIAYGKGGNITLLEVETRKTRELLTGDAASRYGYVYWNLGWSHDSRGIAFKAKTRSTGQDEIAYAEIDSPDGFKVIQQDAAITQPDISFSADNDAVVVAIDKGDRHGNVLHTISRKQPAPPKQLEVIPPGQSVDGVAWSRDGKSIAMIVLETSHPTEWVTEMKSDPSN